MGIVKEMPLSERPREKALKNGVSSLSNRELLAIIIRSGIPGNSALEIADNILERANGIHDLPNLSINQLCKVNGISKVKALELQTCFELSRRITYEEAVKRDVISEPQHIIEWLKKTLGNKKQEHFMAIYLDTALHIIATKTLFIGTVDSSTVSVREIFKEAFLHSATSIIIVHNHPSGVLTPSESDILITRKIVQASRYMDISILDHLIVTNDDYLSLLREGYI